MVNDSPIELQDQRPKRVSEDSLRRDIQNAIYTAQSTQAPNKHRQVSATTTGSENSSQSLMTRCSYFDFDQRMKQKSSGKYIERLHKLQKSVVDKSLNTTRQLFSPFKFMARPFQAVESAWRRRNLLPPTKGGRKIGINLANPPPQIDERNGKPYCSNEITSSIYTVYDFVPRQLLVQFSKLANLYFLFVSILQMIPSWSATGNYTTIIPLCVFVLISMGREGYEDIRRHRNDKEENTRRVLVAARKTGDDSKHEFITKQWKDVQVGEIVRVLQNEYVPADIVLLHSLGSKGQCSIETLALDGETTLKNREVPADIQTAFRIENADFTEAMVTVEDPNLNLFNFHGMFEIKNEKKTIPLGPNNVIYRGSVLRNTASVQGLVVYSGKETKMQLNATKSSRTKVPKLQTKLNTIVIILACFVMLLSGFSTLAAEKLQDTHNYWYIQGAHVSTTQNMMGFIIMFNTLIPLSLYVSMEICKIFQLIFMQNDIDMYDEVNDVRCTVQSASLNEELGQVSYIFSDKTGTLTDNIMLFRKMTVGGNAWIHDLDLFFEPADSKDEKDENNNDGGYLFQKANGMDLNNLDESEVMLLEQLAKLPRRSFGGRISNAARINPGRSSLNTASLNRISMGRASIGRHSMGQGKSRPSNQSHTIEPNHSAPIEHITQYNESDKRSGIYADMPRPSNVTGVSCVKWQSSAAPLKQQNTPSTLTLLNFILTHPQSSFTKRAKLFLLALALCHSASPEVDLSRESTLENEEIEHLEYQASSPDELALVSAARDLGYLVIDRQYDTITIRTYPQGFEHPPVDEVYKVLDTIDFNSDRKRMSVIVQLPDGRIILICKGADNVMIERLNHSLLGIAQRKKSSIYNDSKIRKSIQADLANERRSYTMGVRPSLDTLLRYSTADADIQESGRLSMHLRKQLSERQAHKGGIHNVYDDKSDTAMNAAEARVNIDNSHRNNKGYQSPRSSAQQRPIKFAGLEEIDDERKILEKTLEQIDEFSTEGLRTLMYCHRYLTLQEYRNWKQKYDEARSAISNRQEKVDSVGEKLEHDFEITGATGIEDKLQHGVPEAIDKLRRANIRMWMLTGDKRETAVNIGYSCRLIKDFSTIINLKCDDKLDVKFMAAIEELENNTIAHCVVVLDGQTLAVIENDLILMSLFVELGLRADSVVVCRASPSQKANIVKSVRKRVPNKVMLAIGDGANDIAMIKAADIGIGIAGKEGLQAARSSDFSIGQFRFLLKLLLVHGRWNYVRTCKYILATFFKEFIFYMAQLIFQRYTLFTGTSLFEPWSISMFNTLFTSLPVLCVGTLDQDLSPTSLIAVPELYHIGPENKEFGLNLLIKWLCMAMLECTMISFLSYKFYGENYLVRDSSLYPLGVVVCAGVIVTVCVKVQFVAMFHYITLISILVVIISFCGYLLFNILIGGVYSIQPAKTYYAALEFWNDLGRELSFWVIVLLCGVIAFVFEITATLVGKYLAPSDVDEFQSMERDRFIMRRLEKEAELELHQGWKYQDALDHSWFAIFRRKWPGQPRNTNLASVNTFKRRTRDAIAEHLGIRKTEDYEKEIQEIIERRQREAQSMI